MKTFHIEFTAIDRLGFDIRIQNNQLTGIRIKTQVYQKTDQVVTDIVGFDPFNVGHWITIAKYDNLKGESIRDAMRPTPVSHSPIGLHLKEKWGFLDVYQLLDKSLKDIQESWQKDYSNYGHPLPILTKERIELAKRNFVFVIPLAQYIIHDRTILERLRPEQSLMPLPQAGQDDWLIDENTAAMNRIEKLALRGKLSVEQLGRFEIITHRPRQEGENIFETS